MVGGWVSWVRSVKKGTIFRYRMIKLMVRNAEYFCCLSSVNPAHPESQNELFSLSDPILSELGHRILKIMDYADKFHPIAAFPRLS